MHNSVSWYMYYLISVTVLRCSVFFNVYSKAL